MALVLRKNGDLDVANLAAQVNLLRKEVATARSQFHVDVTSTQSGPYDNLKVSSLQVTAANGDGTFATLKALCANLISVYNAHIADAVAHVAADSTNTLASSTTPATLGAAQTLLTDMKAKFNAHLTQAGVHVTNDSTNTVSAANATDQTSSDTLANALKSSLNAHITSAPAGSAISFVEA